MTTINIDWAISQPEKFIDQTVMTKASRSGPGYVSVSKMSNTEAPDAEATKEAQVVEAAIRAKEELVRQEEVRKNPGEDAPELSATNLHDWIWSGASSLWRSGHFREAVESAIRKLNAETQNKLGPRDVSETDLFKQAFSEQDPAAGNPRWHRMTNDGSKTVRSVQRGARMFAEGIFAGIRNPLAHEADHEMSEQHALEYLVVLSVLARWVAESTVEIST